MSSIPNKPLILSNSERVRAFIKDTGLPFNKAPEALGVSASDFMQWWSGKKPKLMQYKQLVSLGQFLEIDEEQIIEGSYDKKLIRSRLFEGPNALPDRYMQNQFSFVRSSAHIIKFLTLTRGQHFSDMIMRKLNVSVFLYSDLNNQISLNYFADLLNVLAENGLTQMELDSLSAVMFLSLSDTPLGEKFKKAKNYHACYEVMAENMGMLESNFDYSFELTKSSFTVHSFLNFDKHYHVTWTSSGLDRLLRYRQLTLGWFPFLSKLPPVMPEVNLKYHKNGVETKHKVSFEDKAASQLFYFPSKNPSL